MLHFECGQNKGPNFGDAVQELAATAQYKPSQDIVVLPSLAIPKLRQLLLSPKHRLSTNGKKGRTAKQEARGFKPNLGLKNSLRKHSYQSLHEGSQYKQEIDNLRCFLTFLHLPWTKKKGWWRMGGNRRLEGEG